jgi:hypothetical protein
MSIWNDHNASYPLGSRKVFKAMDENFVSVMRAHHPDGIQSSPSVDFEPSYEQTLKARYAAAQERLRNPAVVIKATDAPNVKTRLLSAPKPLLPVIVKTGRLVRAFTPADERSPFEHRFIVDEVCAKHGLSYHEIVGAQRGKKIVAARHEAFYRLSKETTLSLLAIGRVMGGKDHTTCINGIKKHLERMNAQ